jgi:hypothetical protein
MSIWTDIADWIGPTANRVADGQYEVRGIVLHTAEGTFDGTISWQRNPASQISSHFITGKTRARPAQMVDTADRAWTQADGNGHWLSIENEGYGSRSEALTSQQVEVCAQIVAKTHLVYGMPLQATDDPNGRGLGWHGMGGAAWGGHYDCPGQAIKDQRAAILARAQQILNPNSTESTTVTEDDDMPQPQLLQSGFGIDETDARIDGAPFTPLGYDNVAGGLAHNGPAWLVLATDPWGENAVAKVRVATGDGKGWGKGATTYTFGVQEGWVKSIPLPAGSFVTSLARQKQSATDTADAWPISYFLRYGPLAT